MESCIIQKIQRGEPKWTLVGRLPFCDGNQGIGLLLPFTNHSKYIRPGTTVISDEWRAYLLVH